VVVSKMTALALPIPAVHDLQMLATAPGLDCVIARFEVRPRGRRGLRMPHNLGGG
jgi:hypothetical protein